MSADCFHLHRLLSPIKVLMGYDGRPKPDVRFSPRPVVAADLLKRTQRRLRVHGKQLEGMPVGFGHHSRASTRTAERLSTKGS